MSRRFAAADLFRRPGTRFTAGGPTSRLWSPSDLGASLALWLDADDASTITLNGTDVAQWDDKSGNGNHVSNGTAATQPAYLATGWNGKPTVSFTTSGQEFLFKAGVSNFESDEDFTLASAFEFLQTLNSWDMIAGWRSVPNSSTSPNGGVPILQGMSTAQEIGYHNTDQVDVRIKVNVTTRTGKKIATLSRLGGTNGNNGAATVTCTGFSQPTYITNATQTWNSAAATGFQVGGRQQSATSWGNKYISEVVGCNVKLSTEDREKLEGYLAWKWGLEADLPAGHPYKSAPPTVGGSALPLTPPGAPVLLLKESGITEVGSHVASWDSEGSNTLRWSAPSAPLRPQLDTVGALTGAKCLASGDYLRSDSAYTIVKPYVVYALFRVDTWTANRRVLEFATGDYLAYRTSSGQKLAWEQGGVDLVSTSAIVDGDIISVVVSIQTSGGTNRLYVDGVQEATGSPNAATPASTVVGIGARGTDGVNPSDTTFLEMAQWTFADNTASDAFDMAGLLAYAAQQRTAAGGV